MGNGKQGFVVNRPFFVVNCKLPIARCLLPHPLGQLILQFLLAGQIKLILAGVDVGVFGDEVWHEPGKRAYLIKGVEAYRDNHISREQVQADLPTEGYVVRGS